MNNFRLTLVTLFTLATLTISTARADVFSAAYSGVLETPNGGSNFMSAFGDGASFDGVLTWDTNNTSAILDNSLTFFDASGNVLLEAYGAITVNLHLVNAFAADADNIYIELSYAMPVYGATANPDLQINSWLDIYDETGNLLTAEDQWPTGFVDLMSGDYQVNVGFELATDAIANAADVGSLRGYVPVPSPASLLFVLPGLLALAWRKKQP